MQRLAELWRRLLFLLHRDRFERDLQREMQFHIEMTAEEQEAAGLDADEALHAAKRAFGNVTSVRESSREAWGWGWLDRLGQDVRHAIRTSTRNPVFSAVAVLVLAIGIGGNTAIFSLANALVLNPFPYPDADRLVGVDVRSRSSWYPSVPVGDFFAWRERNRTFAAMSAYGYNRVTVVGTPSDGFEGPEQLVAGRATAAFLDVLGVQPARGRFFTPAEDRPGANVLLLSYATWTGRFGARPDVLGRTLNIADRPYTIIGVMPARLALPGSPVCDLWIPAAYSTVYADTTRWDGDQIIGRLRLGATLANADADLRAIRARREQDNSTLRQLSARVRPIGDEITEYARPALGALVTAVGFVLLLACVNLAGLLLARGCARGREMAIRAALGAGRWRLMRQMLTESVMLALCGGALGLLIARWTINVLATAAPPHLGLQGALRLDRPVLLFAFAVSVLTGIVFGLVPAAQGSSGRLAGTLQGARGASASRRGRRTLAVLVVTEIALAVVLLTGGSLLMKSFMGLLRVDTGVRTDHLLTFELALPRARYNTIPKVTDTYRRLLEHLKATPGVISAALVSPLPMSRQYSGSGFQIDNRPPVEVSDSVDAQYLGASPGYFAAAGVRVVAGREFAETDSAGGERVAIVNQTFARLHLPGEDPLAHRVNGARIIGVVGDIRHNGPAMPSNAQIYTALVQRPSPWFGVIVRTRSDPRGMIRAMRAAVAATDNKLSLDRAKPMEQWVSEATAEPRLLSVTLFAFAVFAVLLAAIGVYGVVGFSVGQRTHEIGVRMALGASPRSVIRMVVAQGLWLSAAGAAVGVPIALGASRVLRSLLVGVSPRDPVVLMLAPLVLLAVTIVAACVPALRASRIDPLDSLRCE